MPAKSKPWVMWVVAAIVIIVVAVGFFFIGRATAPEQKTLPPDLGQIVILNEDANGTAVRVSPGWILVLQLPGDPNNGYTWNATPPDPNIIEVGAGPYFTPSGEDAGSPGVLTYTAMAVGLGTTEIDARYVGPTGQEEKAFKLTIEVQDAAPTTSTLPPSTTSPTRPPSTTAPPTTTTTAAPTTTTTAAPTTTSESGTTTTGSGTTTTTAKPTTTTAKPTTTTAKPTTTTAKPTTTLPPLPTTTTLAGTLYINWTQDGQVLTIAGDEKTVVVTLPANPSTGYTWKVARINDQVLKLTGDPVFTPLSEQAQTGNPGYLVWTFDVVGLGSSPLEIQLLDPSGATVDSFYVGLATAAQPK